MFIERGTEPAQLSQVELVLPTSCGVTALIVRKLYTSCGEEERCEAAVVCAASSHDSRHASRPRPARSLEWPSSGASYKASRPDRSLARHSVIYVFFFVFFAIVFVEISIIERTASN